MKKSKDGGGGRGEFENPPEGGGGGSGGKSPKDRVGKGGRSSTLGVDDGFPIFC